MKNKAILLAMSMAALVLTTPQRAMAVAAEGEYYIWHDFYQRLLTDNGENAPQLAEYSSGDDEKFLFVAEASGTSGYVKLRHKATGLYLTASTSNTWSVLLSSDGNGDQYLWTFEQLFDTKITSKKSTGKRLGCDFNDGSTYWWDETYIPVYYDKSESSLAWFSIIPSDGNGFTSSRTATKTAEFTNEYGVREQDAYCVDEPTNVSGLDYHIVGDTPFSGTGSVNLEGINSWLVFESVRPSKVISSYLSNVTIDGATAKNGANCRVEIYLRGAVVIPTGDDDPFVATTDDGTFSVPLGNTSNLGEYSNKARSFTLRRGYMATVATAEGGEDYSRVYVADHADLTVTLPTPLDQRITSVYVRNWHYTGKSGYAGGSTGATEACGGSWYWNWDANSSSSNNLEYIPIKQHLYWPSDGNFYNSSFTAMMMFNEPNHSEQHTSSQCSCGGTIDPWTAYTQTPKFNATGLRIGSPAETTMSYIKEYLGHCDDMKQRCDFACAHGYWTSEWTSDFNTLVGYGRPVWITEWEYGASWTTSYTPSSLNEYASKVLYVLDLLEYNSKVERYSYYPTDTGGSNGWMRELFWDCDYTKGTANGGTVYKRVKTHLGYDASAQATPNWWAPSVKTPEIEFATLQDGEYVLSVSNANGDATATLQVMMRESDGSWTEVGGITDRSELEETSLAIALSDEVREGSVLKVVLTSLFSDTAVESSTYTIPAYRSLDELQNLTFDEGTFVGKDVLTYAKDITDASTQTSGMQALDGWTMAVDNGDARSSGQYAWGASYFLGSSDYKAPSAGHDGSTEGGGFGVVSVWTAQTQYTQGVILPAGDYELTFHIYNAGGAAAFTQNLFGIIIGTDTEYMLTATTYPEGEWTEETIAFTVEEETTGQLSIGYTADNKGSGSMPHLFLDDITLSYTAHVYRSLAELQNLTFDEGTFVGKDVLTYDYDISNSATQTSGMQEVDGWDIAVELGNARAAGQYAWGSDCFLGGTDYTAPGAGHDGSTEGGGFGVVSVWTAQTQYIQRALLPAGSYELEIPIYNAGGAVAFAKNLIGFIANDGEEHLLTATTYPEGEWTVEKLSFTLYEDTYGKLSIGYTADDKGSASMPHLFVDCITLTYSEPERHDIDELQNLTFDEGTFVSKGVRTYDYDITDSATETSGMQEVDGWDIAVELGNARAAGQYAWGSDCFLGNESYTAPAAGYDGSTEGGGFGVVSVWTAQTQYTQDVTLPAGDYELEFPIYNAGGTVAFTKNLIGFITAKGEEHLLTATTYPEGEWTLETISFTLDEDTEGKLSIGYTADNKGSASMPHLFIDYIKLTANTGDNGDEDSGEEDGDDDTGDEEEEDTPDAVDAPAATGSPATYYDLTGRKIATPTRPGVYIVNGKKVSLR